LSSANGSRLFAGNRKSIVKTLTVSLFAVGAIAGVLFAYEQSTKPTLPSLIPKDDAIQIALKAGSWNEQTLRDKKIETTLVHVEANGFSFIVDQQTLQDSLTLYHSQYPQYENHYLWTVSIIAPNNRDWVYTIDATTGEIATLP
jgi:hypothetical protein